MSDQQRARELRDQGINAMRAGNKAQAQEFLAQAAELDPTDEHTWLWLSGTVDTDEERRFCMQKALEANPNSVAARNALEKLGGAPISAAPPPTAPNLPPYRAPETSSSAGMATQLIQPQPDPVGMQPQQAPAQQWGQQPPAPAQWEQPQQWGQQPGMPQQWGQQPGMPPGGYPGQAYGGTGYYVPANQTGQRPGCIGCLAVLHVIGGLVLLFFMVALGALVDFAAEQPDVPPEFMAMSESGIFIYMAVFFGFIGILGLASGVGLWKGLQWGWWLAVCSQGYSVASTVIEGLLSLAGVGGDSLAISVSASSALISLLISGAVYYYYFQPEVWAFFRFSPSSKLNNMIITLGAGILFALIMLGLKFALIGSLLPEGL